ncbi:MAG: hypothetical protein OET44_17215 [Gammaproteobacteria bacterium]|nr:hypothetical protein [Gammaproteobacteria bacterium]
MNQLAYLPFAVLFFFSTLARAMPRINPLRHLQRFFLQPRMRLAWGLTIGRSAW